MKFHNIEQNSEQWNELRLGKFTASNFNDLFMKETTLGYKRALARVVYERITGEQYLAGFSTKRMELGHELEILAREHYEMLTFNDVSNGGFYEYNEWVGCSPDGRIIEENGGVEFKSRDPHIYFDYLKRGTLPSTNKWQIYGQLLCCGFDYVDYMPYCNPLLKTKIIRIERNESILNELKDKLNESIEIVKRMINEAR